MENQIILLLIVDINWIIIFFQPLATLIPCKSLVHLATEVIFSISFFWNFIQEYMDELYNPTQMPILSKQHLIF